MTGAGIMLMSGDVPRGSVCTTNEVSALIEQLQYDARGGAVRGRLPPGPARARTRSGRPGHAPVARLHRAGHRGGRAGRLRLPAPGRRGPPRGAQPVLRPTGAAHRRTARRRAGHGRRRRPGRPRAAGRTRRPGQLAAELEAGADFQYVVHQASGMVAAQLDVSVGQALIRLRAYAFGNDRPLADVAEDVVARRLRFDAAQRREGPRAVRPRSQRSYDGDGRGRRLAGQARATRPTPR